jgi:formate-dependent phosphoribosylglycinamide formyltransferase (GAR transformylase)
MSSSGKGQSTIKTEADIGIMLEGSRGDVVEVIVEACQIHLKSHY